MQNSVTDLLTRHRSQSQRVTSLLVLVFFGFWFVYFLVFWSQAIFFDESGNLMVSHVNMWGDWAAHFTMGSAIGYRELFLTESPFLLGARFSYPFAANFVSGALIQSGVPFFNAFLTPSFVFSVWFVAAIYYFFKTLLSNKVLAIVAALIFLLNGGLGFYYFGQDVLSSTNPWDTLLNPPHEYTRLDIQNIKWISVIDSMIIPQRAFVMGFPLALVALALIYSVMFGKSNRPTLTLIIAGVTLGWLPIIHTHSFLAAGIILSFWLVATLTDRPLNPQRWRQLIQQWGIVGVTSLSLAIPLFLFFFLNQTQGFLQWYPGWLAREFEMNWLVFWFKNWLVTPLLALAGLVALLSRVRHNQQTTQALTWFPFLLLFGLANLFLFQPFVWDNTKLLIWSAVGMAGLTAIFLQFLVSQQRHRLATSLLAVSLFVVTIASGAIDAYWIIRTDLHSYQMYSAEEMELANWVIENTASDSIWLTGDQHNHWLFNLTGRQAVLTYRGWLWTHGYDYLPTETDVKLMFQDPDQTDLYQKYGVDYVVIGPNERSVWGANPSSFAEYSTVQETSHYLIKQL